MFEEPRDYEGSLLSAMMLVRLVGVSLLLFLVLAFLNPPAERARETTEPPGSVIVEVAWPADLNVDVDLWVQGPGDVPVGYSNKGGVIFNLLRDDLGHLLDLTTVNQEISFSRGLPAGTYTVNLHNYRNNTATAEVPCTVVIRTKSGPEEPARQVLASKWTLTREGQERTVFGFDLAADGTLVRGSVNALQVPLRAGRKS